MATAAGAQTNTAPQTAQTSTENEGDDSGKYGLPVSWDFSAWPGCSSVTDMRPTATAPSGSSTR